MPHRLLASAATLAAAALIVTGCDDAGVAPSTGSLAGQTVEVAAIWTGAEQATFRAVLDAFEEATGATVRYTSGGNDLPALLNSRLAGGSPPDVAMLGQPGVAAELVRRGALHPLTGDAAAAVAAYYPPAWQDFGVIDDTLYGVYFKVAHKSIVWYRTDAFTEAGIEPPETWEDFLAVTATLADAGVGPMAVPAADGWVLTDWFENIYVRVAGPERYDQLARHEIPWTDPTVVRTLELLRDYWTLDRGIQGGPEGAMQLTFVQAVADVFGARPKSAMIFQGDFVATEIGRLGTVAVGDGAAYFPWPAVEGSPPAVITAGDQAVALRDTPGAMQLIAFLASPEAAAIAASGGFLSANQGLDPAHYPDLATRQLAISLSGAELLRFDLSDLTPQAFGGGSNASMLRLLQEFLLHPDPERTAAALEAAARRDFRTDR